MHVVYLVVITVLVFLLNKIKEEYQAELVNFAPGLRSRILQPLNMCSLFQILFLSHSDR